MSASVSTLDRAERRATRDTRRARRPAAARGAIAPELLFATGRPLPGAAQAGLERVLGHDLTDVRIHDDREAADLADAAGAAAFVLGSHVFFASGRYDPASAAGRRLLAHEVAHVVQNRRGGGIASTDVISCREAEADRIADCAGLAPPAEFATGPQRDSERDGRRPPPLTAAPSVAELPALRYTDAAAVGRTDTVHVVDLLVRMISRSLRTDPEDRSGRIRAQLARLAADVRQDVLALARSTMPASEYGRLEALCEQPDPAGAALSTPAVGADPDDVAAAEVPAVEPPTAAPVGPQTAGRHTHPDGTTHTHEPGGDGHQHGAPHGLFGSIAAAIFGTSPLFAAFGSAARVTTGTAGAAPVRPPGAVPRTAAAKPADESRDDEAGPVSATDEDLAEGRPAPLVGPKAEGAAAPPAQAGAQQPAEPAERPGGRIADPDAARTELSAALGAGPTGGAAATPDIGAAGPQTGPTDSMGERAASPEQERIAADDRTVLETHSHDLDAHGPANEPEAEAEAGTSEPTEPEPADTTPAEAAADAAAASAAGSDPTAPAAATQDVSGGVPDTVAASPLAAPEQPVADVGNAQMGEEESADTGPDAPTLQDGRGTEGGTEGGIETGAEPAADAGAETVADGGAGPEAGAEAAPAGGGLAACMGGGGAATQPPAPDSDAPSAGCGGGGGEAKAEPAPAAIPDVSASSPDAALASVGALPATDLQQALPRVGAAATADVARDRDAMPPPSMDRPSGAAAALDVSAPIPRRQATPYTGPSQSDKVHAQAGRPTPAPDLQPVPSPSAQRVAVPVPRIGGDQKLTEADAAAVTESIDSVPTTDPELAVDAGSPGAVALEADADPMLVGRQRQALATQVGTVATQGAKDAAAPLGEADIRPHVPPKTLSAKPDASASCPGLSSGAEKAGAGAGGSKYPKVALDAIVAEKSKSDIDAGVAKSRADFGMARDKRDTDTAAARADSDVQMQDAVEQSNRQQVGLRRGAVATSTELRGQWTTAQHAAVDTAVDTSDSAARTGTGDVVRLKREHEAKAQEHVDAGNRQVREAREEAERKARAKKAEAKKEKHGILGWIGSKIASFFEGLRNAITAVFDLARSVVRRAIDGAKKLAHAVIEAGRKMIVGAIKLAGDVIIAAGDVVLAAFPEARAKFRAKVGAVVDTATRKVNEAADALERGIQKLLDALGKALDCALQYLQAGYLAAVDALASVVKAALAAAQQFLDLLADWVAIIADIAGDPIGWLKSLGRSAIDGVKNCLWGALKRSIKQWFNDKVEEVVGVGKLVMNVLLKGCISFADIARMAWDGIKAALPSMIAQLIIEKLVALIIPAGAALSLLIDGLKAGWAAASRILAAFQKFMTFLKVVRTGSGPGAFADLVAAAAVAVIDFISNFLIDRLKGAGKGVGGALKSMAQRIGKTLGRAGRAVGRGVRALGRGFVRGARAGAGLVRRGAAAVVRGGRRVAAGLAGGVRRIGGMVPSGIGRAARAVGRAVDPRRLARAVARSRLGKAVGRGWSKAKDWGAAQRDKLKAKYDEWRAKRKKARESSAQDRLSKAVAVIRPGLAGMLDKGVSGAWLWVRLRYWKTRFRLSSLSAHGGDDVTFEAHVNPWETVGKGVVPKGATLLRIIDQVTKRLVTHPDVIAAGDLIAERARATGEISTESALMGPLGLHAAQSRFTMAPARGKTPVSFAGHNLSLYRRAFDYRETKVEHIGTYPAIVAQLRKHLPGRSDAQIASELHDLATTGRGAGRPISLARAAYLVYVQESRRNPRNLVSAAMTVDLARADRGTIADLPQAPIGAGRAARVLTNTRDVQRLQISAVPSGDPKVDQARKEMRESIKKLQADTIRQAALWLKFTMEAEGLEYFDNPAAAEQWVFDHMLAHYGVLVRARGAMAGAGR